MLLQPPIGLERESLNGRILVWVPLEESRQMLSASFLDRHRMPVQRSIPGQEDMAVVADEQVGRHFAVGPQRIEQIVVDLEELEAGGIDEEGVEGAAADKLVALLTSELDERRYAVSLVDQRAGGLHKLDCVRDCWIELDANDLRSQLRGRGPDVVVVAVDVD